MRDAAAVAADDDEGLATELDPDVVVAAKGAEDEGASEWSVRIRLSESLVLGGTLQSLCACDRVGDA